MKRFFLSLAAVVAVFVGTTAVQAQVPVVTYYTPYTPTTVYYSAPSVATVAPVVTSAPTVTYYRAPTMTYYPTAPVVTRYRPLINRTVVRYPYGAPVVYYP